MSIPGHSDESLENEYESSTKKSPLQEEQNPNNEDEIESFPRPTISVSTIWHIQPLLGNTKDDDESDSSNLSNLIRAAKNYEFGRINL